MTVNFPLSRGAALLAAGALALAAACSPQFNWREVRAPADGYAVALPDKPQTVARELDFDAGAGRTKVTMRMTSTGVGPTMFAVGVARLPAAATAPAQMEATLAWFRDGLVRNLGGKVTAVTPATLGATAAGGQALRAAQAVSADGRIGADGRPAQLAARFYVVDDRLYQVVAIGAQGQIPAAALETFFDSFRLTAVD
jgi:hypothetical protein